MIMAIDLSKFKHIVNFIVVNLYPWSSKKIKKTIILTCIKNSILKSGNWEMKSLFELDFEMKSDVFNSSYVWAIAI